jgi:hypothetical protein
MSALFLFALWLLGLSSAAAPSNAATPALRVRLSPDHDVDRAIADRARVVAERLLASAGIVTSWRVCDASHPCELVDSPVPEVVVILSSRPRPVARDACGLAVGAGASKGTAIVSVTCVRTWLERLSREPAFYAQPLLAMPLPDDVVGAIAAHEIGHIFGLRHGRSGLMRAALRAQDVVELKLGRLGFARRDAARMRAAVLSAQAALMARLEPERAR